MPPAVIATFTRDGETAEAYTVDQAVQLEFDGWRRVGADDGAAPGQPPRTGKGSGRAAWVAYAEQVGVDVVDGMTRDAIADAVTTAAAGSSEPGDSDAEDAGGDD